MRNTSGNASEYSGKRSHWILAAFLALMMIATLAFSGTILASYTTGGNASTGSARVAQFSVAAESKEADIKDISLIARDGTSETYSFTVTNTSEVPVTCKIKVAGVFGGMNVALDANQQTIAVPDNTDPATGVPIATNITFNGLTLGIGETKTLQLTFDAKGVTYDQSNLAGQYTISAIFEQID